MPNFKTECVFVEVTMLKRNLSIKLSVFSIHWTLENKYYIGLEISYVSRVCYFSFKIQFALQSLGKKSSWEIRHFAKLLLVIVRLLYCTINKILLYLLCSFLKS